MIHHCGFGKEDIITIRMVLHNRTLKNWMKIFYRVFFLSLINGIVLFYYYDARHDFTDKR